MAKSTRERDVERLAGEVFSRVALQKTGLAAAHLAAKAIDAARDFYRVWDEKAGGAEPKPAPPSDDVTPGGGE